MSERTPADEVEAPRLRRSLLFFPGNRPDRYEKALAAGADLVCIDLEDAVAPEAKDEARAAALRLLEQPRAPRPEVVLRINSPRTEAGLRDLLAAVEAAAAPDALVIPRVESPEELTWIEGLIAPRHPGVGLVPLVETAAGLERAAAIAAATPRVSAVLFGGVDLSADLGCAREWEPLLYARSKLVQAGAAARVPVLDMPFLDVADPAGLLAETRAAARLGFGGKLAIHPSQVPVIHQALAPPPDEVERARGIVDAYERNRGGVLLLDGKLVERPVLEAARRTLANASAAASGARDV